jgi:hypothetical protein
MEKLGKGESDLVEPPPTTPATSAPVTSKK